MQTTLAMRNEGSRFAELNLDEGGSVAILHLCYCRGDDDGNSAVDLPVLKKLVGLFNFKGDWSPEDILEYILLTLGHLNIGQLEIAQAGNLIFLLLFICYCYGSPHLFFAFPSKFSGQQICLTINKVALFRRKGKRLRSVS